MTLLEQETLERGRELALGTHASSPAPKTLSEAPASHPPEEEPSNREGAATCASLTSEEMAEEVRLLPKHSDACWSIEGARWVRGQREGLTMAGVLQAEREGRLGFSRQSAIQAVLQKISTSSLGEPNIRANTASEEESAGILVQ